MSTRRTILFRTLMALAVHIGAHNAIIAQKITIYNSQPVPTDARSMAFADAMVSDIHDVSTMYSNAASLAYIQNSSILLSHSEERSIHAINESASMPFSLGARQTISFGISVRHVGYVGQSKNDEFKVFEYGYDMAYGAEVFRAMSVGGGLNVRYGKTDVSKLWAVSGLLGVLYTPTANSSYGVVIKGIGHGIIYSSDQISTSLSSSNLPGSLEAGATLRYPTIFRPVSFTISMSNEKIFKQAGLKYKGGIELLMMHFFLVRGGYVFDSGSQMGTARYGAGLRFNRFSCDYAYSPQDRSDEFYRLTLAIGIR